MRFKDCALPFILVAAAIQLSAAQPLTKQRAAGPSNIAYVPVYSSIYHGDLKQEYALTATLSIHNIDLARTIVLTSIDYHSASGKLIKRFLAGSRTVRPLETVNYVIKESDIQGSVGANFIVRWEAPLGANEPIIETIMIGTAGQQGISFTSRGVRIIAK